MPKAKSKTAMTAVFLAIASCELFFLATSSS